MSDKPVRVLSVCTSDSSGGAARAAYRIHRAVQDLGVDSRMFVKQKGTDDPTVLTVDDFIPHHALYRGYDWVRNKVKNKWEHYVWGKYPAREKYFMSDLRSTDIGGALRKIDYDVLHLHWINLRFLPLEQLPKDKPIVWTLHDSWPFCGICHYFFDCDAYKVACKRCPQLGSTSKNDLSARVWKSKKKTYQDLNLHIVSPSQWLGDCARQSELLGRFPVTVIPNCLDSKLFRPLEKEDISHRWHRFLDLHPRKPFVLYGAMNAANDKRKGFHFLLSALDLLAKPGRGESFELIVFGADKPLDGMPLSIPVHYVGYVGDAAELVSLYNLASVMVVPSLTENLSCVIMESLSCGTPVVAFDIGGNGDMIDHQVNGYLAREKDCEDLAQGIHWCLDHAQELAPAARQKVLENYTPAVVGKEYADHYRSLIERT